MGKTSGSFSGNDNRDDVFIILNINKSFLEILA